MTPSVCTLQNSGESNRPLTLILFEKYRDTPHISIEIFLQKYALRLAESSIYTTNLYHDTPPFCIAILLQKYQGQGSLRHPQKWFENDVERTAGTIPRQPKIPKGPSCTKNSTKSQFSTGTQTRYNDGKTVRRVLAKKTP